MKKLLLVVVAVCVCAFVGTMIFAGCSTRHQHIAKEKWSYDEQTHWHDCQSDDGAKLDQKDHVWDDGEIVRPATCMQTGIVKYTCTVCGKTKTVEVQKTAHNLQFFEQVDATCTDHGTKAHYLCSVCGRTFADEDATTELESLDIEPRGHTFSESWSHDDNYHWHDAICGHDEVCDKEEHQWDAGTITTAPGCETSGILTFTCKCGATIVTILPATGHSFEQEWSCDETHHWHESTCGHDIEKDKAEHDWDEGLVLQEGDCTTDKQILHTCQTCSKTKTEIIHIGHNMVYHAAVPASCTQSGNVEYFECTRCGKFFADEDGEQELLSVTIEPLGHDWGEWVTTTNPTCTMAGEKTCECSRCHATKSAVVLKIAHTLEHVNAVEPTYDTIGNIEHWRCSVCGTCFLDENGQTEIAQEDVIIPAYYHNMTHHAASAATCTESGNVEYWSCDRCGRNYADEDGEEQLLSIVVAALGHNLIHHAAVAATCTENGIVEYWSCNRCGKYFADENGSEELLAEELVDLAHGHALEHIDGISATCLDSGIAEHWHCTNCDKVFCDLGAENELLPEQTIVAALGHNMTHHAASAATCTENGNIEYWYCNRCSKYFADENGQSELSPGQIVVAAGHTLEHVSANSPTCTTNGNTEHWHCTVCDKCFSNAAGAAEITQESTVMASLGHNWDSGEVTLEPTETEEGETTYTCQRCGATHTESIAALGINYASHMSFVMPTETEDGYFDVEHQTRIDLEQIVVASYVQEDVFYIFDDSIVNAIKAKIMAEFDVSAGEAEVALISVAKTCANTGDVGSISNGDFVYIEAYGAFAFVFGL